MLPYPWVPMNVGGLQVWEVMFSGLEGVLANCSLD